MTADGVPISIGSTDITERGGIWFVWLRGLSPTITRGQRVRVTYTDPTDGDDTKAIQDTAGNDAASFSQSSPLNQSTLDPIAPGAPTGLTATAADGSPDDADTRIDLAWTAPGDIGSGITGYRIEVSPTAPTAPSKRWSPATTR